MAGSVKQNFIRRMNWGIPRLPFPSNCCQQTKMRLYLINNLSHWVWFTLFQPTLLRRRVWWRLGNSRCKSNRPLWWLYTGFLCSCEYFKYRCSCILREPKECFPLRVMITNLYCFVWNFEAAHSRPKMDVEHKLSLHSSCNRMVAD